MRVRGTFTRFAPAAMAMAVALNAQPALATHSHPLKAKTFKAVLVTAYNTCVAPNVTHKAALALPGCTPPVLSTNANATNVTTFGPKGQGSVQLAVTATDIKFVVKLSDVLNNATPYGGTLQAVFSLRWTDHGCSPFFTTPCTIFDFPLPVPVVCTAGKCIGTNTFNTVIPGAFTAGDESNLEITKVVVTDPDGNDAFRVGVFMP